MRKIGLIGCSDGLDRDKHEKIDRLTSYLKGLGFETVTSKYILEEDRIYPGNGKLRAEELMKLYRDPEITDIFDVSGGNQGNEVLNDLDWSVIKESKARFWGYSDLSTVINAIYTMTGKASYLYSPKFLVGDQIELQQTRFADWIKKESQLQEQEGWQSQKNLKKDPELQEKEGWQNQKDLKKDLELQKQKQTDKEQSMLTNLNVTCVQGTSCEGILVGGNIRCFLKLAGTPYFPDLTDKILLLEAWSGRLPQILTYLNQYKQMGAFSKVRGLLLGTFTEMEKMQIQPDIVSIVKDMVGPGISIFTTREIGHGHDAKAARIGEILRLYEHA